MSIFDTSEAAGRNEREGRTGATVWFVFALIVGYAVYRTVAYVAPEVRERWQIGAAFKGAFGAAILSAWIAYVVARCKLDRARAKAIAVFSGLLLPWAARLLVAMVEFVRGAGI